MTQSDATLAGVSDNWITLIPEDPRHVPERARQLRARERYAEIAPEADEITIEICDQPTFFDCGSNFGLIRCPSCASVIPVDWWGDRMDDDFEGDGFKLAAYPTPCCAASHTLHQLDYEWPQGFGRFALDAMNPNIGKLDERYRNKLEGILGTKQRVIYQHI